LLLPAVLVITLFFILPLIEILLRSFTDPVPGIQNYVWVVTNESVVRVIIRTFVTSLAVTLVTLLLAYPYAYLMTIVGDTGRSVLTLFIMLPLWTSILVRTLAWFVLLQDTGPINDILEAIGLNRVPLIRTPFGVALGMTQVLLPFMVLPLYSATAKIDKRLLPAAASLGAHPIVAFFKVYLPLSRPGIFAGGITVFILGLGFYIIPALLGSPQETMVSAMVYLQVSQFLKWGQGTALGIFLLVITILLLFLASKLSKGNSIFPGADNR
jgi:putative spermidine/putrescine transport system permease protein